MADIKERAKEDAQQEFQRFQGKETEFLAEKYMDFSNKETLIYEKMNKNEKLNDNDFYTLFYCQEMVEQISWVLANTLLYGLGYDKDKKGMWCKKKKGLFR